MISVRRIRMGEGELFKQVRLAALKEAPYAFSSTYEGALKRSPESWQEQADHSAQGGERATFLAFSYDKPVGVAALYQRESEPCIGELLQVWVAPEYRASAAAPLMNVVFEWAEENGYRSIIAAAKRDNQRAIAFYLRCGFKQVEADPQSPEEIMLEKLV